MARSVAARSAFSVVALLLGLCSTAAFALNPTTVRSTSHAPPVAAHAQPGRPSPRRATSPPPRLQMRSASGVRSPLLKQAVVRRPLRMCAADGSSPLQRLAVAEFQGSKDLLASEGKPKHDAIHAQLAASRRRSYEQDRKGCCSKAASYLDSTMARCDEATRDQADDA